MIILKFSLKSPTMKPASIQPVLFNRGGSRPVSPSHPQEEEDMMDEGEKFEQLEMDKGNLLVIILLYD